MTAQRPGARPVQPRRRPAPAGPTLRPLGDQRVRLHVVSAAVVLLLLTLITRLVHLQGLSSTAYADQAEQQRLRTIALPAHRGDIVDRSGHPLAVDVDARAVYADPKQVTDVEGTAAALAPVLGKPVATLRSQLVQPTRFVYLARGLEPPVGKAVRALKLDGIGVITETRRDYPGGQLAASLLGFTGIDRQGLAGLEHAYESLLAGHAGQLVVEEDLAGREIPSGERREVPPTPGSGLQLTIDRDIQWMAQDALAKQVRATRSKGGTVIVMDPRTGDVLALATAPSFDPNHFSRYDAQRLGNPAVSEVYEPGSVNKVVTAAAALETGAISPETTVVVPPSIEVAHRRFADAEKHGTERLTFAGVLAKSSNIGTIMTAQKVGNSAIYDYLRKFGLGQQSGIGFPGESAGLLPDVRAWNGTQAATIPIGQGVSATTVQIAQVYATVANGGMRVPPRLVKATLSADGKAVAKPLVGATRVIKPSTAATLTRMLESVTTVEGTAPAAAIDGYRIAGKTGTARKVSPDGRGYAGYISSFVGYAPADDPRLLVEVVLDEPKTAIFGGVVSAPVFHDVMAFSLQSLHVPPTGTKPHPFKLTAD